MKTASLLCVALLSISALANASSGTVQFSGRVVDPGCSSHVSGAQELRLEGCPIAAQALRVRAGWDGDQRFLPAEQTLESTALSARIPGTDRISFSDRYQLQPRTNGIYLVVIDYP